ncbi:MAG: electron transport complex subunit RsxA [Clostridia bacterium]|nr:electron transport complex subunit RsxA [Clostridia bacterium]
MSTIFLIIIVAAFINNAVLVQCYGICPFLGVSKKMGNALGMGLAVTLVMAITCLVTFPIYNYVLIPLGLEFLEIIVFIFVIAALVQMLEKVIKKFMPPLYNAMGIYLPLITTNCAVLGVAETVMDTTAMETIFHLSQGQFNVGHAVIYGIFLGLGFTLAICLMSGLRDKVDKLEMSKHLKGFPITMATASFMAMAFYVFALVRI